MVNFTMKVVIEGQSDDWRSSDTSTDENGSILRLNDENKPNTQNNLSEKREIERWKLAWKVWAIIQEIQTKARPKMDQ
jgi:hypothetical protein